ncbi:MAG: hypothetical protein QG622_188 [Actinomycetota bacterium]|nr:hypothetical protein [Actinomycetota bacterium]
MREYLAEFATGALPEADRRRVARHLAECDACRAELAGWQALRDALAPGTTAGSPAAGTPTTGGTPELASPAAAVRAVLARSAAEPFAAPVRPHLRRFVPALLRAEIRVVPRSLWAVSTLVMAVVAVLASWLVPAGREAGQVLAIVVPLVTAAGLAGVHGPGRDPAFEITAATPTSPGLLLLVRTALVLGFDVVLATVVSGVVVSAGLDPGDLIGVIEAWLGPTALLAAASVLVATRWGAETGLGVVLGVEGIRILVVVDVVQPWLGRLTDLAWSTNSGTVTAALVLLGAAAVSSGRGEPRGRRAATHLT